MFYVKLFVNAEEVSANKLIEPECPGYSPIAVFDFQEFTAGKPILFNLRESATIYGCYVITRDGDLVFRNRFNPGPFVLPEGGGQIAVEFVK